MASQVRKRRSNQIIFDNFMAKIVEFYIIEKIMTIAEVKNLYEKTRKHIFFGGNINC